MNIGLLDVDGKFPNLALMKISAYHKQNGDNVDFATIGEYDKLYENTPRKKRNNETNLLQVPENNFTRL